MTDGCMNKRKINVSPLKPEEKVKFGQYRKDDNAQTDIFK